jgi:hypothetical protein|eukprot:COSAG01_NODE_1504_length_10094_cov_24.449925_9_plen_65_part_00
MPALMTCNIRAASVQPALSRTKSVWTPRSGHWTHVVLMVAARIPEMIIPANPGGSSVKAKYGIT